MSQEKAITVPTISAGKTGAIMQTMEDMFRFAKYVAVSPFAPKGMEKPEAIMVAMQFGMELGLTPMQSIQTVAVVNGRPSIYGDTAKALVDASGLCTDFSEWFEGEKDALTAICEIHRKDRSRPVRQTFSVADAKAAGLWDKAGPWKQYPRRMLQMRARGFAIRDAFPDVLRGLVTQEEAGDYIDVTPQQPSRPVKHTLNDLVEPGETVDAATDEIAPLLANDPEVVAAFDALNATDLERSILLTEAGNHDDPRSWILAALAESAKGAAV